MINFTKLPLIITYLNKKNTTKNSNQSLIKQKTLSPSPNRKTNINKDAKVLTHRFKIIFSTHNAI